MITAITKRETPARIPNGKVTTRTPDDVWDTTPLTVVALAAVGCDGGVVVVVLLLLLLVGVEPVVGRAGTAVGVVTMALCGAMVGAENSTGAGVLGTVTGGLVGVTGGLVGTTGGLVGTTGGLVGSTGANVGALRGAGVMGGRNGNGAGVMGGIGIGTGLLGGAWTGTLRGAGVMGGIGTLRGTGTGTPCGTLRGVGTGALCCTGTGAEAVLQSSAGHSVKVVERQLYHASASSSHVPQGQSLKAAHIPSS
jgi:hypothetical protein